MDDKKILLGRLNDLIKVTLKNGRPVWTTFLNPAEQSDAIGVLDRRKDVKYTASGGYNQSERRVFCISDLFSDIPPSFDLIKVIQVDFDAFNTKWMTHRSVLGAVLGLGCCDRRMVGDIVIKEQNTYLFVIDSVAELVLQNLVSVGRAAVSVSLAETESVDIDESGGEVKRMTVAGLRIDAILSGALNMPRSRAAALVETEKVFVNWKLVKKTAYPVDAGDTISVRGVGRLTLDTIGKHSAKGRTWIEITCFLT